MEARSVWHSDPHILGGTPVFVGTRVPVQNLIDYLIGDEGLGEFLLDFPRVSEEQAKAFIEQSKEALLSQAT